MANGHRPYWSRTKKVYLLVSVSLSTDNTFCLYHVRYNQ